MNAFWDRLGISASLVCVIHCLVTPFLVLLIPILGNNLSHAWFHLAILVIVFPVAVFALWRGYRLHRMKRVLWMGGVGLLLMLYGTFAENGDNRVTGEIMICAGLILTAAHYLNLRACRHSH